MKTRKFIAVANSLQRHIPLNGLSLTMAESDRFKDFIKTIPTDGDVEVTIGPIRKDRSGQQNRYYWGIVVDLISEHTGFTPEEMHEFLKSKFISRIHGVLNTKNGLQEFERTKSTTELSTKEFEDYMTQIREWASIELGVFIPEPNEVIS